ncbi:MAG TPA: hypothetical protein VF597_04565 [Candidatus Saccharimonadales bacterium]|jgi:hypothetical protein
MSALSIDQSPQPYEITSHEGLEFADVDTLIERTKTEIPPLTAEKIAAIDQLDEFGASGDKSKATETAFVVGVLSGVKPSTIIYRDRLGDVSDQGRFDDTLEKLDLSHVTYMSFGHEINIISRHPEIADALVQALDIRAVDSDVAHRRIGQLLGYPETATDYFIERLSTLDTTDELPRVDKTDLGELEHFSQLILSPEHYEDEIAAYVRPLADSVHVLAPKTYELLTGSEKSKQTRRHKIGSAVVKQVKK